MISTGMVRADSIGSHEPGNIRIARVAILVQAVPRLAISAGGIEAD